MNLIALLCEEANNTEIITVIVNACVSVISVLLGFGLSKFTERTSWARRKSEQIREHQITSMTNFLHQAKRCILLESQISQLQNEYQENKEKITALQLSTLMGNINNTIKSICEEIAVIKIEIEKYAIELKFLKFSKNELQAIEKFLKVFNNIFDIVTKSNRYCENVFDVNLITEATNLLDDITNTSLQGLTNK